VSPAAGTPDERAVLLPSPGGGWVFRLPGLGGRAGIRLVGHVLRGALGGFGGLSRDGRRGGDVLVGRVVEALHRDGGLNQLQWLRLIE
jgi:hypothetical protein